MTFPYWEQRHHFLINFVYILTIVILKQWLILQLISIHFTNNKLNAAVRR